MSITIEVRVDRVAEVVEKLPIAADAICSKSAFNIVRGCISRSRRKTGQMRAGWRAEKTGNLEYTVSNPVEHTIYNEFGTIHMSAQPMLQPSVEAEKGPFQAAWEDLEGQL